MPLVMAYHSSNRPAFDSWCQGPYLTRLLKHAVDRRQVAQSQSKWTAVGLHQVNPSVDSAVASFLELYISELIGSNEKIITAIAPREGGG